MAKSLRSKWKKKMRAIKRVRYGQKELEKLKAIVARHAITNTTEIEASALVNVIDARDAASRQATEGAASNSNASDLADEALATMEVEERKPKYNRRTMKDENGKYPVWLNKRRIRQLSIANKKANKAKAAGKKKLKAGGKRRNR